MARRSNIKVTGLLGSIALCAWIGISGYAQTTQPIAEQPPAQPETEQTVTQSPSIDLSAEEPESGVASESYVPSPPQTTAPEQSAGWAEMAFPFIRTLGAVGLVLCLIVAASLAFRKYAPRYFMKGPIVKSLRMIETLSMGEKRSIALVQAGGQQYLVGNTPHQISLLAVLNDSTQQDQTDDAGVEAGTAISSPPKPNFLKLYQTEKRKAPRKATSAGILPDDIRGKMRELRQALER